jgi:hydroxymethylglutaryl-CoA lyase
MKESVRIIEVGPRDGLQAERQTVATATKLKLITSLADCGLTVVEATSFVNPKWVPQLHDAEQVMAGLEPRPGTRYPVLVPNLKGLARAMGAGAREIAVFTAASESFSRHNTNCSIAESLDRVAAVMERAREADLPVRAHVSCVLGCPYEGATSIDTVVNVSERLLSLGCDEISLGDTIGVGTPGRARELVRAVAASVPFDRLAVHFHDTYGQALANILACLEAGVRSVDASVAGLGGCPYAPGASGNVATEDVVYMLHGLGFDTGVDIQKLAAIGQWISEQLQRPHMSKAGVAIGDANRIKE